MADKKRNWVKIAESLTEIGFGANGMAEVQAGEKTVCLAKYKEELFAFAAKCPHAGGQFVHGFLDGVGNVVCPLHRYKFCPRRGRNVTGEGYYLKHWPVRVAEDGVFVGLDSSGLLSWL